MKRMILAAVALTFVSCGKPSNIEEFQRLVQKVSKKNEEMGQINMEISDAVKKYNESRKADEKPLVLPDSMMGLNKEQLAQIQSMIEKEQDLSMKGMLNQIIEKDKQIDKLSTDLEDLKARLPRPYAVKGGDSHFRICYDFLVKEKGVDPAKAKELLNQTFLADDLLPGFNVWLYYNDEVFGTFVNQGSVRISPNQFSRIIRKRAVDEAREAGRQEGMKSMTDSTAKP